MDVPSLLPTTSPATTAAREVVVRYSSAALVNHCERSYLWSAALGELTGIGYDRELLYVASMVAQMIAVGEETGNLDAMLSKVADFYEAEVAAAVKALTSILEPVMIILVGGIVGFIVIAMYMPMFKVYDAIK